MRARARRQERRDGRTASDTASPSVPPIGSDDGSSDPLADGGVDDEDAGDASEAGGIGDAVSDPNVSYWGVFRIDPSRGVPGTYDWHTRSTGAIANAFNAWHGVVLSVATGRLTVTVDGVGIFSDAGVVTAFRGVLGFTAAVGGVAGAGFDVDEVKTTFPNPACGG